MEAMPEQIRAGRALLDWTQAQAAEAASVSLSTVKDFEAGRRAPTRASLDAMQAALEAAGVEFTGGDTPGVRLRGGVQLFWNPDSIGVSEGNRAAVLQRKWFRTSDEAVAWAKERWPTLRGCAPNVVDIRRNILLSSEDIALEFEAV